MREVLARVEHGVALITFHRPAVKNAISLEMVDELEKLLSVYKRNSNVKVLVFTGEGDSFIAGGDINQFLSVRGAESLPVLTKVASLLTEIENYPKPTIAMLNGHVIGGGCEFAGACHFRFASDLAKIAFVQIGMHITTGWGGGSRLLAKLPESKALELLLTGDKYTASSAKELGFVDKVFPHEQLYEQTLLFARKIAAQPLASIEAFLTLLRWKREGIPYEQRISKEVEQCSEMWGSEQHLAVVSRFLK